MPYESACAFAGVQPLSARSYELGRRFFRSITQFTISETVWDRGIVTSYNVEYWEIVNMCPLTTWSLVTLGDVTSKSRFISAV